jgi:uncharacterized protein
MKLWKIGIAATIVAATTAMAVQSGGVMPEPGVSYHQRQNCHGAYDLLNADVDAGGTPSDEDRAWARAHEDAAVAGKPCPTPPEALAKRAANRRVSTGPGMKMLGRYTKLDDPVALFEAGFTVLTSNPPMEGVTPQDAGAMIRKAADLGDPHANFIVGSLFVAGQATGKPAYSGVFLFIEKAGKAGHADALNMLGSMYIAGLGTKKNPKLGFEYLSKAAANGHVFATFLAAKMAIDGEGIKRDLDLGYRLARNLADQGEVSGAVLAASALLQRKDAVKQEDEVLYWMDMAERGGDAKVRSEIGRLRPQVLAAFTKAKAPPQYVPRVRKVCPMKTVCYVSAYTGARQSCTTNKDYWNDCDL